MNQIVKNQMFWMLQDVITYFGSNPGENRCVNEDKGCFYNPPEDSKSMGCAIGMYLDEKLAKKCDKIGTIEDIYQYEAKLFKKFPKWMQNMPIEFLETIQSFHDDCWSFNPNGISDFGKNKLHNICDKFKLPYNSLTFPKTKTK